MPPVSTGHNFAAQRTHIVNLPARYVFSHTSLPCPEYLNLDSSAQDSQPDTDFDPDTLTDEETSTG